MARNNLSQGDDDFTGEPIMQGADGEAFDRTMYGSSSVPNFASLLPHAGDPEFETDAQNNDEYFMYDPDIEGAVE